MSRSKGADNPDPDAPVERPDGVGPSRKQGGRPGRTGRERAQIDARRLKVESLELQGASVRQMADILKVDYKTAWDDLQAVRKQRRASYVEQGLDIAEERVLELERLERQRAQIETALASTSRPPTPSQIAQLHRVLLQIGARKDRLLGLAAPARISLQGLTSPTEADTEGLEDAPQELTLRDLLGDAAAQDGGSAIELAKVIHLALPPTGTNGHGSG